MARKPHLDMGPSRSTPSNSTSHFTKWNLARGFTFSWEGQLDGIGACSKYHQQNQRYHLDFRVCSNQHKLTPYVYTVWDGMSVSVLDAANVVMQVQPFNSPGSLTGDRRGTRGCWNFGFSKKNQTRKTKKRSKQFRNARNQSKKENHKLQWWKIRTFGKL